MESLISIEERMLKLKENISRLEWDLPNLKNNELRKIKEDMLLKYKQELTSCSFAENSNEKPERRVN